MPFTIKKIYLENYRQFRNYTIETNKGVNILVGDNEAGKTTILEAIDLAISGSSYRLENIGLDSLLNAEAVKEFQKLEKRTFEDLPKMKIEISFDEPGEIDYKGRNNKIRENCNGVRLICEPDENFQNEINEMFVSDGPAYFPYDYYSASFSTFADRPYLPRQKGKPHSILIDSSSLGSQYATADFVKRMYSRYTEGDQTLRATHKSAYRESRSEFSYNALNKINDDEALSNKIG